MRKISTYIFSFIILLAFIIMTTPAWVFSSVLTKATSNKLYIADANGSLWNGDGLLMIKSSKKTGDSPLLHVNWSFKLGFTNLVSISLYNDDHKKIFNADISKSLNITLSDIAISLPMIQLTKLYTKVSEFGLSGQVEIKASKIEIGKVNSGVISVGISNLVSTISPINPVGSYHVDYNLKDNNVDITTIGNAAIFLNGSSNVSSLSIKAVPAPDKKDKLLQLMTIIALPNPDGSYNIKLI